MTDVDDTPATPTELAVAEAIANRVLDRVSADPDDDMAVLARQLLRQKDRITKLKGDLHAANVTIRVLSEWLDQDAEV